MPTPGEMENKFQAALSDQKIKKTARVIDRVVFTG
jgi:hypothetical protein